MGRDIVARSEHTSDAVRNFVKRAKDVAQALRLMAIAEVRDGTSRQEAATVSSINCSGRDV